MKKDRIAWIDAVKGATIISVIIGHCLNGYLNAEMFPSAHDAFQELHGFIYSFHMPLFFIISGMTFFTAYFSGGGQERTLSTPNSEFGVPLYCMGAFALER